MSQSHRYWIAVSIGTLLQITGSSTALAGVPVDPLCNIGKAVRSTSAFYFDVNGNGVWDGNSGGDSGYPFGSSVGIPLVGDWNGDGTDEIGVYIDSGKFLLDRNGNRQWDGPPGDSDVAFAVFAGLGVPIICDWDGDGDDDLGLVVGTWYYIDLNGNGTWNGNAGGDRSTNFAIGGVGTPVVGAWLPH